MTVTVVAAIATNGVIGHDGAIPWHLPADLANFKRLTMGHALVMGRRTYESIGRPLPGRTTVVITSQRGWDAPEGVIVACDIDDALERAGGVDPEVFVVGGAQVYAATLDRADRLVITHVDLAPEGDTYFPEDDWADWREVSREPGDGLATVTYERAERREAPR